MTVRTSMLRPIAVLRRLGNCAYNDQFNDTTYWTDEQLQEMLDAAHLVVPPIKLKPILRKENGVFRWWVQMIDIRPYMILEEVGRVVDVEGYDVPSTSYTVDYVQKVVQFDPDLAPYSSQYYFEAPVFHLYEAAANVWQEKANQRVDYVRWKAGNYSVNAEAEYQHCLERARYYRGLVLKRHAK